MANSDLGNRRVWLWQVLGKLRELGFEEARESLVAYYDNPDFHKVCPVRGCKMNHHSSITDRCERHFDYRSLMEVE